MKTKSTNDYFIKITLLLYSLFLLMGSSSVFAQQFVTDDYYVMPYKSSNLMLVAGDNFVTVLPSVGLFPGWEIFAGANLLYEEDNHQGDDRFYPILMAKHNVWENARKTGGVSWTLGTGLNPSYYNENQRIESFRDVYGLIEWTIPMANDRVQFDINPGFSAKSGDAYDGTEWDFTYAARIAWIKGMGNWSPIIEAFGSEGDVGSDPQYKAGFRWEPNDNFRFAVTYNDSFDSDDADGAGLEIGIIMVTVPCEKGCSFF